MINAEMRSYDYFTLGELNAYGQETLSEKKGVVKMAISITSHGVQNNINYSNCSYMGLTHDKNISDSYVIKNGEDLLKVQFVNAKGRYKQVFMRNYD